MPEKEVFAKTGEHGTAHGRDEKAGASGQTDAAVSRTERHEEFLVEGLPAWNLLPPQQIVRRKR